jgi:hypothetical protein
MFAVGVMLLLLWIQLFLFFGSREVFDGSGDWKVNEILADTAGQKQEYFPPNV